MPKAHDGLTKMQMQLRTADAPDSTGAFMHLDHEMLINASAAAIEVMEHYAKGKKEAEKQVALCAQMNSESKAYWKDMVQPTSLIPDLVDRMSNSQ